MNAVSERVLGMVLWLVAGASFARAMDAGAASAPGPAVSVVWVIVFLAIFVGICVWIGMSIWRSERKNRASSQENARP
jgi:hypothetical protein